MRLPGHGEDVDQADVLHAAIDFGSEVLVSGFTDELHDRPTMRHGRYSRPMLYDMDDRRAGGLFVTRGYVDQHREAGG